MSKLTDKLKKPANQPINPKKPPVWKGPESTEPNGGITFSMLSRWLVCRERFRIYAIEGLKPKDSFNANMEYGTMWHAAEEAHAAGKPFGLAVVAYCAKLYTTYPFSRGDIDHWCDMCLTQFPIYLDYWKTNPDVINRTPLFQEQVFDVPYTLPSGRVVRLRGKWDSGDIIGEGKEAGIYLPENKTKSQIDSEKITRQLSGDLQVMLYLIALGIYQKNLGIKDARGFPIATPIKGVRYNVIRRSSHKSSQSMLKKLTEDIADSRGGEWFARWKVEITPADIERFKQRTLNPILEQLCDWWGYIEHCIKTNQNPFDNVNGLLQQWGCSDSVPNNIHWQHPFGVWSVLDSGGESDLDAYIHSGSMVGLRHVDTLFTELQE